MGRLFAVVALLVYIVLLYVMVYIVPAFEKEWEQAGSSLTRFEVLLLNASRFLGSYGVYILLLFIVGVVYVFMVDGDSDKEAA